MVPRSREAKTMLWSRQSNSATSDVSNTSFSLTEVSEDSMHGVLLGDVEEQQQQLLLPAVESLDYPYDSSHTLAWTTCSSRTTFSPRSPNKWRHLRSMEPTWSLPVLVFVDMLAVSLVVPLLFQYYHQAGIHTASQREILSSVFSAAQILGGLMMGLFSDAGYVDRRTLLLFSFGGSVASYGLLVLVASTPQTDHASSTTPTTLAWMIWTSRVLVGLVKQTMTVCTTLMTQATTPTSRAAAMGRLTAATTMAWMAGPTLGAILYRHVHPRTPPLLACLLFMLNMALAFVWLTPSSHPQNNQTKPPPPPEKASGTCSLKSSVWTSLALKLRTCFSSPALTSVVMTELLVTWVTRATNSTQLGSFYEDLYHLKPYHRGYLSSYQQFWQFLVQSFLVGPILHRTGGERRTIALATALLVPVMLLEGSRSLILFLLLVNPLQSLCLAMLNLSIKSLLTSVAPTQATFSVLAALDILQNVVSVSVPFYRTLLFRWMPPAATARDTDRPVAAGDPDPGAWIVSTAVHWLVAAVVIAYLLLFHNQQAMVWVSHDQHVPPKPKGT